jgi:hypothetical protein
MENTKTKLPDAKTIATILVALAVVVVLIILVKNIGKIFNLFGKGADEASKGLGLSNSDDKQFVNKVYASQDSPLFSNDFDKLQKNAPVGSALLTTATIHTLINKLKDARGTFTDDDADAVGLFDNFRTQFMVAWFAKRFQVETGSDLFTWLRKDDTLFAQGFAAGTVAAIIRKVNALPKY